MGKIAGIKDKSLETYPEKNGPPSLSTQSVVNTTPVTATTTALFSLLPDGPLEAGGSGDRIIVMFSGQLQWPNATEVAAPATVAVGIYLDGSSSPSYSISVYVPASNVFPATPPQPIPFSLFWETPADGQHSVDIKAQAGAGTGVYAANGSLVLISTPN